ncbi:gliding motility protein GldM [Bacteroidales bacterium OttesenSCG-928-A17]|nr:gliding motility protein GldM [Bacteroidales bacterium OttesenSCG-928-A17]
MAANSPNSPRQRMINLMYLVFIAMLALNVSSEVLDGFELVEETLLRSVKASTHHNNQIFSDLQQSYESNREKTEEWYLKGDQVKAKTDSLFNYIQDLKLKIVKKSDGKEGDPENMRHPDDLNASQEVMFQRGKNDGEKLRLEIDAYREFISELVTNPSVKNIIENNLNTEPTAKAKEKKQSWEESMFWNMPMAAAITLLTKIQNDIRYAEGEVLSDLVKNIDIMDVRVNSIEAFVIPESQTVMAGGVYSADFVLAAVDTTQKPQIVINGKILPESANGKYTVAAGSVGTHSIKGHIEMPRGDGSFLRKDFATEYYVTPPTATIAPVLMNVLYAGIPNDISIAAAAAASHNITATCTNGTLTRKSNDIWTVTPRLGSDAVITITAKMPNGKTQVMGSQTFRVRPLPDPTAFLYIKDKDGNERRFRGGAISKSALIDMNVLNAAIDDGILDIKFAVLNFYVSTTDSKGITIREQSNGANFSPRQKDMIRGTARGKNMYITGIVTRSPDGSERPLQNPIEIVVN